MKGINFLTPDQRASFDNKLINIATQCLSMTKQNGNESKDYDYNCLVGNLECQLRLLSQKINSLRIADKEKGDEQ
jgi:hypothetical protein